MKKYTSSVEAQLDPCSDSEREVYTDIAGVHAIVENRKNYEFIRVCN